MPPEIWDELGARAFGVVARGCAVIRWRLNSLAGDDEEVALLLPVVIGELMSALQRLVGTDELQRQVGDWLNERRDQLGKPPAELMFVRCTCTP